MATLRVCTEADEELDALYEEHEEAAATFDALLSLLEEQDDLLEHLCQPSLHFLETPSFEVKLYAEMQRRGFNIYTVKVQLSDGSWPRYRVLIGFNGPANVYHVLAVAHRDIVYERTDPLFSAVVDRYERASIPSLR